MNKLNIKELFTGLYKTCDCGCGYLIPILTKEGIFSKYKQHHSIKFLHNQGAKASYWKGGRYFAEGYWRVLVSGYYTSNKAGYVREHVYNFQEYHKCCLLKWGNVHHVDGDKENNMPWNLQGMMSRDHSKHHHTGRHVDTSDRICFRCGTKTTLMHKPNKTCRTPTPVWCHLKCDKINWYCSRCYDKLRRPRRHSPGRL